MEKADKRTDLQRRVDQIMAEVPAFLREVMHVDDTKVVYHTTEFSGYCVLCRQLEQGRLVKGEVAA